jgi:hypothetical protein
MGILAAMPDHQQSELHFSHSRQDHLSSFVDTHERTGK